MYDATQDYNASFALSGVLFLIAGFIGVALELVQKYQQRQKDVKKETHDALVPLTVVSRDEKIFVPVLPPLHEENVSTDDESKRDLLVART